MAAEEIGVGIKIAFERLAVVGAGGDELAFGNYVHAREVLVDVADAVAFEDGEAEFAGGFFCDCIGDLAEVHLAGELEVAGEDFLVEVFEANVEFEKVGAIDEVGFFEVGGDGVDALAAFDLEAERVDAGAVVDGCIVNHSCDEQGCDRNDEFSSIIGQVLEGLSRP